MAQNDIFVSIRHIRKKGQVTFHSVSFASHVNCFIRSKTTGNLKDHAKSPKKVLDTVMKRLYHTRNKYATIAH